VSQRRIKHRTTPDNRQHWPFGVKLKPDQDVGSGRVIGIVLTMMNCPRCPHPPDNIAETLLKRYPILLANCNALAMFKHPGFDDHIAAVANRLASDIDPRKWADTCRAVADEVRKLIARPEYQSGQHLNIVSRHANVLQTTEAVLEERMSRCLLCSKPANGVVHWFRVDDDVEEHQLLFGLCDRCEERKDRESRINKEVDYLLLSGVCISCGEKHDNIRHNARSHLIQ
jgi:hypothetical protein